MLRTRIQVYTDPETKQRIERAAAKRELAVTEYCLAAIEQQLIEDNMLEEAQASVSTTPAIETDLLADLQTLRDKIQARRRGQLIDVAAAVEQAREERDQEIYNASSLR
ncbi:MAG: hypothetical protein KIT87_00015 [Anaerolineae bacterium]|nr:hypothetical protein [Anaerolineae bacterium]